ncbi:DciA family protein [Rickettsiales bacterium]|nr:DciA family protein [Rickettsiales bacterium]MDB2550804.1 DciA family protein [Rickettsiales bacterium]
MFKSLESNILSNINPIILKKKKKNFNILYNLRKNWQKIIGDKYFYFTSILDLKINRENKKTLHVAIYNPTIAFLLASQINDIIEEITIYYGYKAIDDIKFIQTPKNIELQDNLKEDVGDKYDEKLEYSLQNIEDQELKDVLLKLGREIINSKQK